MKSKGFLTRFLSLLLIFAVAIGISGCTSCNFIRDDVDGAVDSDAYYQDNSNGVLAETALVNPLDKVNFSIAGTRSGESKGWTEVDVIENVKRSVVSIRVEDRENQLASSGTGVIINFDDGNTSLAYKDYYILTCFHVINAPGAEITVYVPDGQGKNFNDSGYDEKNYAFKGYIGNDVGLSQQVFLVGGDKTSDIAVLRLRANSFVKNNIQTATVTEDGISELKVGSPVVAIGNALGYLPGRATTGTIAYINRLAEVDDVGTMTLLELDLNIYHGNSGGGLFNLEGELVGITNCGDDTNIGINYAIPARNSDDKNADTGFVNIANQLIATETASNYGYVSGRAGKFGFSIMNTDKGVEVVQMNNLSGYAPAYEAGMRVGNVIVKAIIGGKEYNITTVESYNQAAKNIVMNKAYTLVLKNAKNEEKRINLVSRQVIFCNTGNYAGQAVA